MDISKKNFNNITNLDRVISIISLNWMINGDHTF